MLKEVVEEARGIWDLSGSAPYRAGAEERSYLLPRAGREKRSTCSSPKGVERAARLAWVEDPFLSSAPRGTARNMLDSISRL